MVLDWIDPSDFVLGLLAAAGGYLWLRGRGMASTRRDWARLFLVAAVYTGLDYLTGISGAPWHWWNQLPL